MSPYPEPVVEHSGVGNGEAHERRSMHKGLRSRRQGGRVSQPAHWLS